MTIDVVMAKIDKNNGGITLMPNETQSVVETTISTTDSRPSRGCRFCCKRPFHGNREAIGWCLDVVGRTIAVIAVGAFVMPSLIKLSTQAAGCDKTETETCDKTVHGLKPSSLLTTIHTIVAVVVSPFLPLFGSIVDHTSHRLVIGRTLAILFLLLYLPQVLVSESTWFAISIIQIFMFVTFIFLTVSVYSYLPELTHEEDVLNDYTRNFTVIGFTAVVVYIAALMGATGALGIADDATRVARIASSSAFVIAAICLVVTWFMLFQPRPPLHELPPDQSILTAGFVKLYHSSIKIWRNYKALKWFYLSVSFGDAATQSMMTIMITFLTDKVKLTAMEMGISVLILLVSQIPAGCISGWCSRRFNPIISSLTALFILIVVTACAAIFLQGPEQKNVIYFFIVGWGLGLGWKLTVDRMLLVAITPPQQSTEFMGAYLFFGSILTWIPPLIFTSLNEAGISQRVGLAMLDAFYLIAFICYCMMGSYKTAVAVAGNDLELHDDHADASSPAAATGDDEQEPEQSPYCDNAV